MATKKPRKGKKYNPERSLQAIVNQYVKKVYCYDGKCFPEMQFNDVVFRSNISQAIKKRVMYAVGEEVLPWSIMLMSFESDGKQEWVETWDYEDLKPESSNNLNKLLDGELEKRIDGRNPKHVITWGWFAIALKEADLDSMRSQIIDRFIEAGAFNRKYCEDTHAKRIVSEKLENIN